MRCHSYVESGPLSDSRARLQMAAYFVVAVLGFSFWFFIGAPFASHRESYWWLAMVQTHDFATAFSFISKTYRPLAQGATWLGFMILDPRVFPTSVLRQAIFQGFVYMMFVLAWWLVYPTVAQRRLFAVLAFLAGGVFFSGYVQMFHIYGIFYVPVMLSLGALLRFHGLGTFGEREVWFAIIATLLAFWHPFATALFLGFYFGYYLDTFRQRSKSQHIQALAILLICSIAIAALVVFFPTQAGTITLHTRLFGFLVSYETNEVNLIASVVAFVMAQMVVLGMRVSSRMKLAAFACVSAVGVAFYALHIPLLLLWLALAVIKILRLRSWSLFFLMLTAVALPFGGAIGTPIYGLFAIITGVYITALGWPEAERALSFLTARHAIAAAAAAFLLVLMVRAGIKVPVITRVATPLLTERERTYQLENLLYRLHSSDYCGDDIAFVDNAGNPIDSVQSAMTRRHRPPAALGDVRLFWNTILRCPNTGNHSQAGTAVLTFDGPPLANLTPVFKIPGRYAGDATVWVNDPRK
jgi:hypothetical protein